MTWRSLTRVETASPKGLALYNSWASKKTWIAMALLASLGVSCGSTKLNFKVLFSNILFGDAGSDTVIRLGSGEYLASSLQEVFGTGTASFLDTYIRFTNTKFDDKSCDPNRDLDLVPCSTDREFSNLYADPIQLPSVPRAGQLIRTVNGMVFADPSWLGTAIQKATGSAVPTAMPTEAQLVNAWRLFHPGQSPPPSVVGVLQAMAGAALANGENFTGAWAYVFLTLGWDVAWQIP